MEQVRPRKVFPARRKKFSDVSSLVSMQPNGCWQWGGRQSSKYGMLCIQGQRMTSHNFMYKFFIGQVPQGLELDHLCQNKLCCNPFHMEPVTHHENMRRRHGGKGWVRKTHCPSGHPYEGSNIQIDTNGYQRCRACRRGRKDNGRTTKQTQ